MTNECNQCNTFTKSFKMLRKTIEEISIEKDVVETDLKLSENKRCQLETIIDEKNIEIKNLQNELEKNKKSNQINSTEIDLLKKSIKEVKSDLQFKEKYIETLLLNKNDSNQLSIENKKLNLEVSELTESLAHLKSQLECKQCLFLKTRIQSIKSILKEQQMQIKMSEETVKQFESEINNLEGVCKDLKEKNNQLQREIDLKNDAIPLETKNLMNQICMLKSINNSQKNQLKQSITKYCKICKETAAIVFDCFNHNLDFTARTSLSKDLLENYRKTKITLLSHMQTSLIDEMIDDDEFQHKIGEISQLLNNTVNTEDNASVKRVTRSTNKQQMKKNYSDRSPSYESSRMSCCSDTNNNNNNNNNTHTILENKGNKKNMLPEISTNRKENKNQKQSSLYDYNAIECCETDKTNKENDDKINKDSDFSDFSDNEDFIPSKMVLHNNKSISESVVNSSEKSIILNDISEANSVSRKSRKKSVANPKKRQPAKKNQTKRKVASRVKKNVKQNMKKDEKKVSLSNVENLSDSDIDKQFVEEKEENNKTTISEHSDTNESISQINSLNIKDKANLVLEQSFVEEQLSSNVLKNTIVEELKDAEKHFENDTVAISTVEHMENDTVAISTVEHIENDTVDCVVNNTEQLEKSNENNDDSNISESDKPNPITNREIDLTPECVIIISDSESDDDCILKTECTLQQSQSINNPTFNPYNFQQPIFVNTPHNFPFLVPNYPFATAPVLYAVYPQMTHINPWKATHGDVTTQGEHRSAGGDINSSPIDLSTSSITSSIKKECIDKDTEKSDDVIFVVNDEENINKTTVGEKINISPSTLLENNNNNDTLRSIEKESEISSNSIDGESFLENSTLGKNSVSKNCQVEKEIDSHVIKTNYNQKANEISKDKEEITKVNNKSIYVTDDENRKKVLSDKEEEASKKSLKENSVTKTKTNKLSNEKSIISEKRVKDAFLSDKKGENREQNKIDEIKERIEEAKRNDSHVIKTNNNQKDKEEIAKVSNESINVTVDENRKKFLSDKEEEASKKSLKTKTKIIDKTLEINRNKEINKLSSEKSIVGEESVKDTEKQFLIDKNGENGENDEINDQQSKIDEIKERIEEAKKNDSHVIKTKNNQKDKEEITNVTVEENRKKVFSDKEEEASKKSLKENNVVTKTKINKLSNEKSIIGEKRVKNTFLSDKNEENREDKDNNDQQSKIDEIKKRTEEAKEIEKRKKINEISGFKIGAAPLIQTKSSTVKPVATAVVRSAKVAKRPPISALDKIKKKVDQQSNALKSCNLMPMNKAHIVMERSTRQELDTLKVTNVPTNYISGNKRSRLLSEDIDCQPLPKRFQPLEKKQPEKEKEPSKFMDVKTAQMLRRKLEKGDSIERFQLVSSFISRSFLLAEISPPMNAYRDKVTSIFQAILETEAKDLMKNVSPMIDGLPKNDWDMSRFIDEILEFVKKKTTTNEEEEEEEKKKKVFPENFVNIVACVVVNVLMRQRDQYKHYYEVLLNMMAAGDGQMVPYLISINLAVLIWLNQPDVIISFIIDMISLSSIPVLLITRCIPPQVVTTKLHPKYSSFIALLKSLVIFEFSITNRNEVGGDEKRNFCRVSETVQRFWLNGATCNDFQPCTDLKSIIEIVKKTMEEYGNMNTKANWSFLDRIIQNKYQ